MRQQVIISVTELEANGESGFNNTASIVVKEPASGTLEVNFNIIHILIALPCNIWLYKN